MAEQQQIFEGKFPRPNEGFRSLHQLAKKTPTFLTALDIMKETGIRDRLGTEITEHGTRVRSFRNMSEHVAVVGLVSDGLAEILELPDEECIALVTSSLLHDATKRGEVIVGQYRRAAQEQKIGTENVRVFEDILSRLGVAPGELPKARHITESSNVYEFHKYFNEMINRPFLMQRLAQTSLSNGEQQRIATVASSDSFDSLLPLLVRMDRLGKNLPGDATISQFRILVDVLRERQALPIVLQDNNDSLAALLWYADSITAHNRLVTIDDRIADIIRRGDSKEIDEWGKTVFDGRTFFDVGGIVDHVIERWIVKEGQHRGTLDAGMKPEDLPKVIMERLQARVA